MKDDQNYSGDERNIERTERLSRDSESPGIIRQLAESLEGTFQLEMLISGTVLFLFLGLREQLQAALQYVLATRGEWFLIGFTIVIVANGLVYLMLANLITHLMLRSYWVGLVGLATVFPHGYRLDRARGGPAYKNFLAKRPANLDAAADKIDKACRVIFGLAFTMLATILAGAFIAAFMGALAWGLKTWVLPNYEFGILYLALYSVVMLPYLLVYSLDTLSANFRPLFFLAGSPGFQSFATRVYGIAQSILIVRNFSPALNTISTNLPKRAFSGIFVLYFLVLYAGMFIPLIHVEGNPYTGDASISDIQVSSHYENLRDDEEMRSLPIIQSDVILRQEGFVKLFIPYSQKVTDSLTVLFPGLRPITQTGVSLLRSRDIDTSQVVPVLKALTTFYQITLDDSIVAAPNFRLYQHPVYNQDGLIAYLPVQQLASGEHILILQQLHVVEPKRYVIPFLMP